MNAYKTSLRANYPNAWPWIGISRRIPGWLTEGEANALFELARFTAHHDSVVVELGSWQGKSSILLAAGLRGKLNARLFCVDPFESDEDPQYQKEYYDPLIATMRRSLEDGFHRNIRRCGLSHLVHAMKGYSYDVVRGWKDPIDLLFIDANHEYDKVRRDFALWSPFVRPGGVIALHDVSPQWPGPSRVMAEELQPPRFRDLQQADCLVWATKQSEENSAEPASSARTVTIPRIDYEARLREIERLRNNQRVLEAERDRVVDPISVAAPQLEAGVPAARVRELEMEIAALQTRLHQAEALRGSWSWRLTAPLRAMVDAVRFIFGMR